MVKYGGVQYPLNTFFLNKIALTAADVTATYGAGNDYSSPNMAAETMTFAPYETTQTVNDYFVILFWVCVWLFFFFILMDSTEVLFDS